jgi:hypothetical protein
VLRQAPSRGGCRVTAGDGVVAGGVVGHELHAGVGLSAARGGKHGAPVAVAVRSGTRPATAEGTGAVTTGSHPYRWRTSRVQISIRMEGGPMEFAQHMYYLRMVRDHDARKAPEAQEAEEARECEIRQSLQREVRGS